MEETVKFENRNGRMLFGIAHVPEVSDQKKNRVGINLLNPGIKYRVAPNRLNVKIARELCNQGYYVFRFDPEGIGDSSGELPVGAHVADIWGRIQRGQFVCDTLDANDYFLERYKIEKLVLLGNCGGAITALLSAKEDARVSGLCLIDIPLKLMSSRMSFADLIAEDGKKAQWFFSEYMKRLVRPSAWYRFLTLQSNYRALWKTVLVNFKGKTREPRGKGAQLNQINEMCRSKQLNPLFFRSFELMRKRETPILFVLAGNDPGTEVFRAYFERPCLTGLEKDESWNRRIEVFEIEDANHIYTLEHWQESLIMKIKEWVGKHS